jgi:protein-S-isoprenylcysteine O-methyltransferase Ste14
VTARRARRFRAALGSALFLVVAPGTVAGLVPWLLTGWDSETDSTPLRIAGVILIAIGVAFLLHSFARFVIEGIGTPAPVAPPEELVIGGAYGYVRNPMYLAVGAAIIGQALLLGRPVLLAWAVAFGALVFAFVRLYEEPTLSERFGASYETYRQAVPGWLPRLHPWEPGG